MWGFTRGILRTEGLWKGLWWPGTSSDLVLLGENTDELNASERLSRPRPPFLLQEGTPRHQQVSSRAIHSLLEVQLVALFSLPFLFFPRIFRSVRAIKMAFTEN